FEAHHASAHADRRHARDAPARGSDGVRAVRPRKRLPHARRVALRGLRLQDRLLRLVAPMEELATRIATATDEFRANQAAMQSLLDELRAAESKARAGGGARAHERHRAQGKLPVRERLDRVLDPGSPFLELSPLAAWGMYDDEAPGAGIVTGI